MSKYFSWGLFLLVAIFLWLTQPVNRTEAEDAYAYSTLVERGQGAELCHVHHVLYAPVMRGVFRVAQWSGRADRALPILVLVSCLAGAGVIALFFTMLARDVGAKRALPFAIGLLFCYGFWRYACEAEIYVVALLFPAGAWALFRRQDNLSQTVRFGLVALSICGVGMHVLNALPLIGCLTLGYIQRRQFGRAVIHGVGSIVGVLLLYAILLVTVGLDAPPGDSQLLEGGLSLSGIPKAGVALAQALVSGNFLFISPEFSNWIQGVFPYRCFVEEVFMGRNMAAWHLWGAVASLLGLCISVTTVVWICFRRASWALIDWQHPLWIPLAWLIGSAGVVFFFEPGNPEMWIMALFPLGWLIAHILLRAGWWIWLPVLALGLHNWIGGMALLQSVNGDFHGQREALIKQYVPPQAMLLTAGSYEQDIYLEAMGAWQVVNARFAGNASERVAQQLRAGEPIWVLGDVFAPDPSHAVRFPAGEVRRARIEQLLKTQCEIVSRNSSGVLYRLLN